MPAPSDKTRPREWILIEDRAGLDLLAKSAVDRGLVAGNAHIAAELSRRGLAHLSGEDLQDYADAIAATDAADADMEALQPQLLTLSEPLRAISLAILAREGLRHHALRRVAREIDAPLLQAGLTGLEPVSGRLSGTRVAPAPKRLLSPRALQSSDYVMDFSSATGQKGRATAGPCLQPRLSKRPAWQDAILNALAMLALRLRPQTPQALRVRLTRGEAARLPQIDLESDFAPRAKQILVETAAIFAAAEATMDRVLRQRGLPKQAIFNNVGDAVIAGFQTSLRKAGVDCEMSSHGALAAWGMGPRHRLAAHLGAIYNAFPGMTRLHPRARQLVPAATPAQIVKRARLQAPRLRRDGAFRVYAAPSFRPWSEGLWGITNTCFDTLTILEALAGTVRRLEDVEMFLRIKLTAKDIAKPGKRPLNRGLFPEDVAHLIDPSAGIHDASRGAHSQYLADSDLVVTEGLTAVMFEALEMRCPVLLIVPDPRAAPALPAASVRRLGEPGFRSAVYTASPADDLAEALRLLVSAHCGLPLTEAEVASYIWTAADAATG